MFIIRYHNEEYQRVLSIFYSLCKYKYSQSRPRLTRRDYGLARTYLIFLAPDSIRKVNDAWSVHYYNVYEMDRNSLLKFSLL